MRKGIITRQRAGHVLWLLLAAMLLVSFMPRSVSAASAKKVALMRGETKQLKKKNAVWTTKNRSVADVSPSGLVTARGGGKTVVTARVGKKQYRYRITVEAPYFTQTTMKLSLNQGAVLRVKGTSKKFRITSSNSSVVSVKKKAKNKFRVTALKDGVATVTATYKNVSVTCVVTAGKGNPAPKKTLTQTSPQPPSGGVITLSHNGTVLQTLSRNKSDIARSVSAVSSYGQSAPLYMSTAGGDGLESIYAETNNGNVNVPGVKLSEEARIGTIQKACAWARAVCNSKYHGYDDGQGTGRRRFGWGIPKPDSPGTGDYCCYTLAICAYYFAGVNMLGECLGNPSAAVYPPYSERWFQSGGVSFWGDTEPRSTSPFGSGNYYPKLGFVDITDQKNQAGADKFVYEAGDIVTSIGHQHEQLIIKTGTAATCEAAEACGPGGGGKKGGDQSGNELKVYTHLFDKNKIGHVYRFTGAGVVLNTVGLSG